VSAPRAVFRALTASPRGWNPTLYPLHFAALSGKLKAIEMTAAAKEKREVTLPEGVSLRRVAQVLLDAWEADPRRWMNGPSQLREEPAAPGAAMPVPQDALDLFRLLADRRVDYLLVGGMAMLTYVKGRNTKDVDLLLSLDASHQVPELEIHSRQDFFARAQFRSVQVDLLFTFNPLFKNVAARFATKHRFAELEVPAATVAGLIVLKLYALPSLYRQFDMDRAALYENDITMLLANHSPEVEPLLDLAAREMKPGDRAELRRIISECGQRADRLRQRTGR
jgi:hypothetical protein